jgi:hypothetical protein
MPTTTEAAVEWVCENVYCPGLGIAIPIIGLYCSQPHCPQCRKPMLRKKERAA